MPLNDEEIRSVRERVEDFCAPRRPIRVEEMPTPIVDELPPSPPQRITATGDRIFDEMRLQETALLYGLLAQLEVRVRVGAQTDSPLPAAPATLAPSSGLPGQEAVSDEEIISQIQSHVAMASLYDDMLAPYVRVIEKDQKLYKKATTEAARNIYRRRIAENQRLADKLRAKRIEALKAGFQLAFTHSQYNSPSAYLKQSNQQANILSPDMVRAGLALLAAQIAAAKNELGDLPMAVLAWNNEERDRLLQLFPVGFDPNNIILVEAYENLEEAVKAAARHLATHYPEVSSVSYRYHATNSSEDIGAEYKYTTLFEIEVGKAVTFLTFPMPFSIHADFFPEILRQIGVDCIISSLTDIDRRASELAGQLSEAI